jgi:hypothetical protein
MALCLQRSLLASGITLALLGLPTAAQAATIGYDFTLTILVSDRFNPSPALLPFPFGGGSFSYDDAGLTGIGFETVTPSQGNLSLLLEYQGYRFNEAGLIGDGPPFGLFVSTPQVQFQNGDFLGLAWGFSEGGVFLGDLQITTTSFTTFLPPQFRITRLPGFVTYEETTNAVPEPTSMLGGLAALGLGAWWRKRRTA